MDEVYVNEVWTDILCDVYEERLRQVEKFGTKDWPNTLTGPGVESFSFYAKSAGLYKKLNDLSVVSWETIMLEEVLEALAECGDDEKLREELVQVAAVAVAWIENIDRRKR